MKKLLLVIGIFCCQWVSAQDVGEEKPSHHQLALVISHAHIPQGIVGTTEKQWLVLGSWGIDYNYWFNDKWAIGLHTDMVLENYKVQQTGEDGVEGVLERTFPVSGALMAVFKPGEHIAMMVGTGGEYSKEETLYLIRAGAEYGWELPDSWELALSLMYDMKVDTYNSWVLGLGVSKRFGR